MIEFVSATRATAAEFENTLPLGKALRRLQFNPSIASRVSFENRTGLAKLYNQAIDADNEHDILVFLHDDIWLDDYFVGQRVLEGLRTYDVIGVAGTRRRLPGQDVWAVVDYAAGFDSRYLSGFLSHGTAELGLVNAYGPIPAPCELLDGVFLAARKSQLRQSGVRFDERFDFHFYDLDFCRTARAAGLKLGTWPVAMTHQSVGVFGSESWIAARKVYFDKWGD